MTDEVPGPLAPVLCEASRREAWGRGERRSGVTGGGRHYSSYRRWSVAWPVPTLEHRDECGFSRSHAPPWERTICKPASPQRRRLYRSPGLP